MIACKLAALVPDRVLSLALLNVTGGGYECFPKVSFCFHYSLQIMYTVSRIYFCIRGSSAPLCVIECLTHDEQAIFMCFGQFLFTLLLRENIFSSDLLAKK